MLWQSPVHLYKLQAGLSGIIGYVFREMVKDRTYAALAEASALLPI
jgi:hypothetical protein